MNLNITVKMPLQSNIPLLYNPQSVWKSSTMWNHLRFSVERLSTEIEKGENIPISLDRVVRGKIICYKEMLCYCY